MQSIIDAKDVLDVTSLLSELQKVTMTLEQISQRVGEEYTRFNEEDYKLMREGVSLLPSDQKLKEMLWQARFETEQIENSLIRTTAYLSKFIRLGTQSMIKNDPNDVPNS